jgi:lysozyme
LRRLLIFLIALPVVIVGLWRMVGEMKIGVGSTGAHVKPGMTITQDEADALLRKDVSRFEAGVAAMAGPTTQNRFDAMVSFAFNVGLAAFGKSTLLKKHKAGAFGAAAEQFSRWTKAGGKELAGLVRRRAAEAALYRSEA